MTEQIGVIQKVRFGNCGYQECMIGFSFTLGGKGWGTVHEIIGGWNIEPTPSAQWTHESRIKGCGEAVWKVSKIMEDAKVTNLNDLVGKPVVVTFESPLGKNTGFKILTDCIL